MKLSTLLILISLLPLAVFSQFTLESSNFPAVGEEETYTVQITGLDVENGGPDQTWNFSFISGGEQASLQYLSMTEAGNAEEHPTADLAEASGNLLTYLDQTESEVSIVGLDAGSGQVTAVYSDPIKLFTYPFDYLDSYIDDYEAELLITATKETALDFGTYEVTYDGYGSLMLPYGILENTARRKAVNNFTEVFNGDTLTAVTTTYNWYVEDYAGVVAVYAEIEITGQPTQRVVNILTESDFNSIQELQASKVSIYPNPSSDFIQVQTDALLVSYEIINLQGQTVQGDILGFDKTLSVSELPSGTYMLQLLTAKGRIAKKILVE